MKHPHPDLSFTYSRREFWPALLREAFVLFGTVKGGQSGQLAELGSLPDSQLAQVRPIISPSCEITVDQDYVCARSKKTKAVTRLFPMEEETLIIFNYFNGEHTLGAIGTQVAREMCWDEAQGFARARDLFLSLVGRQVCVPRDPPPLDG
jgi:hypothetical protein